MGLGPFPDSPQWLPEGASERGKGVVDAGRILAVVMTVNEAIDLKGAQGFGENFRSDAVDTRLQLSKAHGTVVLGQRGNDENRPPSANAVQDGSTGAIRRHDVIGLAHKAPPDAVSLK